MKSETCTAVIRLYRLVPCLLLIGLDAGLSGANRYAAADQPTTNPSADANQLAALGNGEPLSPVQAVAAMEVAEGFRAELVAAEPLVVDPVAFCFDADGRLIVVEMQGYSERADASAGRVRRLFDDDGDGQMDRAETLLDGLSWPTAVAAFGDGFLVGVAPDIRFLPDPKSADDSSSEAALTGRADTETWWTGFGRSNVQGLLNSFRWGPDLRLHGAASSSGGTIRGLSIDQPLRLGRRDFSIGPITKSFRLVPGGGQHGLCFDRWGDKFVCSNSDHLQQILLPPETQSRAARVSAQPSLRRSIAVDGPQAEVYRSSPVEPWRVLRTQMRVRGEASGPVEGGGRAAGYFTGATGVYVVDGDNWPSEDSKPAQAVQTALVCDVGSNLIHRKRLQPDGLWRQGERIDPQTEFLRSSDNWFRPVQLGSGPDGAVYIADMAREVIEHPKSFPPWIKARVDLNRGNDRGRIWRIVADGPPLRRRIQPLTGQSDEQLIALLSHSNAWHRRTAARLLVQRLSSGSQPNGPTIASDDQTKPSLPIAALRTAAIDSESPEGRMEALAVLSVLPGGPDELTLQSTCADAHARVRARAIECYTAHSDRLPPLDAPLAISLAHDHSIHVRFRLAFAAADLIHEDQLRGRILAQIATSSMGDPWIRWAVEGSLGKSVLLFATEMRIQWQKTEASVAAPWCQAVVCQVLQHQADDATAALINWLEQPERIGFDRDQLLHAVASQIKVTSSAQQTHLVDWIRADLTVDLRSKLADPKINPQQITDQLRLVRWASPADAKSLLEETLQQPMPQAAQAVAIQQLLGNDPQTIEIVIDRLGQLSPPRRSVALEALLSSRRGQQAVLSAVQDNQLDRRAISAADRQRLVQSPDASIRQLAAKLLASQTDKHLPAERQRLLAAVSTGNGDADAGEAIFKRHCHVCHVAEDGRPTVGPPLRSVVNKPVEQIAMSIIDPDREVDPKYHRVQIITDSGQMMVGIITEESITSVELADHQGNRQRINHDEIEQLRSSARSLMPNDFVEHITEAQMRDLIAYLKRGLEDQRNTDNND